MMCKDRLSKYFYLHDINKYYLIPVFLILNCLTIKSSVGLHYIVTSIFSFLIITGVSFELYVNGNFKKIIRPRGIFLWVIILGFWMLISSVFIDHSKNALINSLRANYFFIVVYFLSLIINDSKISRHIIYALIFTGIITSLGVVMEFFQNNLQLFKDGEIVRYDGFINTPNVTGYIISITSILLFSKLKSNKLLYIFLVVNVFAMFLTSSRSAWLMFAVAISVYFLIKFPVKKYYKYYLSFMGVLILAALLFWQNIYELGRLKYGITYRDYLWEGGFKMFLDHPFWGVGAGNFKFYISDYIQQLTQDKEILRIISYGTTQAHSFVLTNLAELGIIGILLIFIIIVGIVKNVFRIKLQENFIYQSILIGFAARTFFETGGFLSLGWFAFDIYLWVVIIVANFNLEEIYKSINSDR